MAELEIRRKLDPLRRGYVAIRDENHVCNGPAWKYDAANKLADQINAAVLICDCHYDAVWYEKDSSDCEGKQ